MRIHAIIRNVLFTLFIVYYAQGSLYNTGALLAKICLVLIFVISGIYYLKTFLLKNSKGAFFYAWSGLLIINIIGFILTGDFSNIKHIGMFKNIIGCLLPFYPFYFLAINNELKSKHLIVFFIILLPLTILQFYVNQRIYLSQSSSTNDDVVNNIAYSFVMLIPFVFLIKNKKILGSILMIIIMLFIIQGAKRGAIISGFAGLIIYFYYQFRTIDNRKRISGFIIALIMITLMSVLTYNFFLSNDFLQQRLSSLIEGNSSGRDYIYATIFNTWYTSANVFNQIVGFGFASSITMAGDYAHNDWLELLSNFGLIGILIYIFLFYSLSKLINLNAWNNDKRILIMVITVMWFLISLVSMWYTSLGMFTQSLLLAYLIGSRSRSLV